MRSTSRIGTIFADEALVIIVMFRSDTLLLFGATGDLARRMLLPSLFGLTPTDGSPGLRIVGTARSDLDDAGFRKIARGPP